MRLNDVVDFLFGYTEFEVEGFYAEEFLNGAVKEELEIWHIRRKNIAAISARTRIFNIKKVEEIAKKAKLNLSFRKKEGLPPFLYRYRLRYGIISGIFVLFLFTFIMSSFIWTIEVKGNSVIDSMELLQSLEEHGLKKGSLNTGHDIQQLKGLLIRDFNTIAHVGINLKGSRAEIEITERIMPPETIDQYEPCNVIAAKTGQIVVMETYSGVPQFKAGQGVEEGQLLVSGVFDSKYVGYRMVHASAKVLARTLKKIELKKDFAYTEITRTGEAKEIYRLSIFDYIISLFFNANPPYQSYQQESEEIPLKLGSDVILPIKLIKTTFYETKESPKIYNSDELLVLLKQEIDELSRLSLHNILVEDKKFSYKETQTGISAEYICIVIEDIAVEKRIFRSE